MAFIEVDHRKLREAAEAITAYCSVQDQEMRSADEAVKSMLSSGWTGADAREFGHSWEGVNDKQSTAVKFRESLEQYAECLSACADAYQNAQADSYNEANRLPKYIYW